MASQVELKAERDALSKIRRIASSMSHQLSNHAHTPCDPFPNFDSMIPNLDLPFPHDILSPISTLPIPYSAREDLIQCFNRRVGELQRQYTTSYRRACLESVRGSNFTNNFMAVHKVYEAMVQKHYLPMVSSWVAFVLTEIAKYPPPVPSDAKRPFNNEYTPILEKYFEYNAYPSAKHQEVLAQKSMMLKRQIEVWFQNHRNRAKKDGKPLRRLTSDLPLQRALTVVQEGCSFSPDSSPAPSDEDWASETMDEDVDLPQPTSCIEAFESFRPPHAFPTAHASTSCPDPFPNDDGVFKFPPPTWMRKPATALPPSATSSSIDINEFARVFHLKLNILEGTRKRATISKSSTGQPWFAATVTAPPRAPHPAFISKHRLSRSPSSILPILANSFSFQFPMGSGTTSATNAFLPPPLPATPTTPRKMAPLPRRLPTAPNLSPTAPSSPRTLSSSSRSSSFSSDTSTRSRISSSSSSNSSPEPSTPPPLPSMEIPAVQDASLSQQHPPELDIFSELFGDTDPEFFTNFDFSSMNNMPMQTKQPQESLFDMNSFVSIPPPNYMATQS